MPAFPTGDVGTAQTAEGRRYIHFPATREKTTERNG